MERLRGELNIETFDAEWAAGGRYTLTEALRTTEIALTDVLRAVSYGEAGRYRGRD